MSKVIFSVTSEKISTAWNEKKINHKSDLFNISVVSAKQQIKWRANVSEQMSQTVLRFGDDILYLWFLIDNWTTN